MRYAWLIIIAMTGMLGGCKPNASSEASEDTVDIQFVENKEHLAPNERWGELFERVQMQQLFPDGKTFVDCTPKYPTDQIMAVYMTERDEAAFDLKKFVEDNFDLPDSPATDFAYDADRTVDEHINALWPVLTRQPDEEKSGSLIELPYPYIVPGGRFREVYYWDSYFTMLGLKAAGRTDMIENMVKNFAYLIDTVGFIPNGNRTYYLTRSQPPFFAAMLGLFAQAKGDSNVLVTYLPQLRKEYNWWMTGTPAANQGAAADKHVVTLPDGQLLNRYYDQGDYPRAESHREDVETAQASGRPLPEVYRHLRSGAESGWDFSGRWLADGQTLATIETTDIIPVDLNALLYSMETTLADAYRLANQAGAADSMRTAAQRRRAAVDKYCWDAQKKIYQDYNFRTGKRTDRLSLAGLYPLYFRMASPAQAAAVASTVQTKFLRPGGVVSTLVDTDQQWDLPNGWPPLQWLTIQGLRNYGHTDLAQNIEQRWVDLNRNVYQRVGKMVEKYNVIDLSLDAGGGEYPVQDGFGWSNGVLLHLLRD